MKFLGALVATAALVSGDSCYMSPAHYAVNLKQVGTKLHVTAKFNHQWVGFGIPRAVNFDEMPHADFVIGGGGVVYDKFRDADTNGKPNADKTGGFINGTQSVKTVDGLTTLSFVRELAPQGRIAIDATKPFRFLWAGGDIDPNQRGFDAIQYHGHNRGSIMVDLSTKGNCDAATLKLFPGGKGKAKGKKAKAGKLMMAPGACPNGQAMCTAALQAQGLNCIINQCTSVPATISLNMPGIMMPAPCSNGLILCTAALQAQGMNCIINQCVQRPMAQVAICTNGQILCTAALQAQGMNCIINQCTTAPAGQTSAPPVTVFRQCPPRQVLCTADNQQRLNCVLNQCAVDPTATGPCPPGQIICNPGLVIAKKCILNACVDMRLGADGH